VEAALREHLGNPVAHRTGADYTNTRDVEHE
jgi:hypothetical protein